MDGELGQRQSRCKGILDHFRSERGTPRLPGSPRTRNDKWQI